MNKLRCFLNPVLTLTFLGVGGTGLMMLFHVRSRTINHLHEWTGFFFVLASLLHVVLNWRTLWCYLKTHTAVGVMALVLLLLGLSTLGHEGRDGSGEGRERPTPQVEVR